ncbi:MAG: lipid-A-disaccharide synthase, partial [Pseudomonadota bacterium]
FAAADVALATSGTVALELAAAGTPMVSAFDLNWLSRVIIPRLLITDTTCLVNLVTDSHVVPEVIGFDFTPANVLAAMEGLLADPSKQAAAMEKTMDLLGRGGEDPGLRAARAVLNRM